MKGAHAELTFRPRRPPEFDVPRVLVAAGTASKSCTIAEVLRRAGYIVSTSLAGDVLRHLREHKAIELLVFDGSGRPLHAAAIIGALRVSDWALPIILIGERDPELRAEAARVGVEAILDAPVAPEELRRVATKIVPVVPEMEFNLAG